MPVAQPQAPWSSNPLRLQTGGKPADAQLAKLQCDVRPWTASRWDRALYGEDRSGNKLQINIGQLHLDALRQRQLTRAVCP